MNAYRNYNTNTSALSKNLEKLSSGYKINRAGDDAAGLAISEKMRAQITGLNAASKNVKDGISLVKTAEGAMQEIQDMLNRMDYLATQSANGTYDDPVDRANLQKEVDALKTEINRIADSANFNGIKLLDGKLGLNADAFEITSASAVAQGDSTVDITSLLAASNASSPAFHKEGAAAAASTPKFTVDLGTLTSTGSKAGDTIKITVAGNEYTLTAANNGDFDTTQKIAQQLEAALKKQGATNGVKADGTAAADAAGVGLKVGRAAYTIGTAANGAIEFTYMGRYAADGTTFTAETTFTGDDTLATAINTSLGFAVSKGGTTGTGAVTGDVVHDTTKVDQAKKAVDASLAGIDMQLTADVVKNNYILEIDGNKFQFKTSANGFTQDGNVADGNVIDLTAEKEADWVHAAVDKLSKTGKLTGTEGREWKIAVKSGDTIHFEQVKESDAGKELDSHAKVTAKIKMSRPASSAKNVGTTINIKDPANVKEGDGLTIGEGKNSVRYVFTKDANKTDTADTKYVQFSSGGADAAANLQTKLAAANLTTEIDGNKVTIRAASATDAAPVVRGRGLTLQIGDTFDSFNQMNVAVGDMHVKAMGTKGGDSILDIDISTQTGASDAVQTIRDAINYVSSIRGDLGATQNRLEHTANNLSVMAENIQDAESTIRDTDVAEEMMKYTKNNILIQSAQAMLAQANAVPQGVLQLLG